MVSNRTDRMILFGFIAPAFVLLAVFYIFPTLWAVRVSFTDLALTGVKAAKYGYVGLQQYQRLFSNPDFYGALEHTFVSMVRTFVWHFLTVIISALLLI